MAKKIFYTLLVPIALWAGPPMHSNDPFVPKKGQYEVNLAFSTESRDTKLSQFPIIDANYGLTKNLEITLATAYIHENHINDIDAFEAAMKWLFYNGDFFSIAISPVYFSFPINSVYHTGETHAVGMPVNFALSQNLNFVMDFVYINPKNEADHFEMGTYISYSQNKHTYFLEGFSDDISSKTTVPLLLSVGYTYSFSKKMSFLISYGEEIVTQTTKARIFYSGLQLLF